MWRRALALERRIGAWKDVLWELSLLYQGEAFGPICRAPSADGNFTKNALTSKGATLGTFSPNLYESFAVCS